MNIRAKLSVVIATITCIVAPQPVCAVSPAPDGGYPGNNTAEGTGALLSLTSGVNNTAFGFTALTHDTSGANNTAAGAFALSTNTTGAANTATGVQALYKNTTGIRNTADGTGALLHNNGSYNSATGWAALVNNTSGTANTADGAQALFSNTTGSQNTAEGAGALLHNTSSANTAVGWAALFNNTTGDGNVAVGYQALQSATGANSNTGVGPQALESNTTGNANTAIGPLALSFNTTGAVNTACGSFALGNVTTGGANTGIGRDAGSNVTTASGVTCLGEEVSGANVDNTTWIAHVYGVTTVSGTAVPVVVSSTGQLGTAASSARFKKNIKPMQETSETILQLRPVMFHYKTDEAAVPQFGLVAEEVEKVNPDLVVKDVEGKPFSVRYDSINAMLLNEFLKEHRTVQELRASDAGQRKQIDELTSTIRQQQKVLTTLAARLDQHDAQFQKVNAAELSESNRQNRQ